MRLTNEQLNTYVEKVRLNFANDILKKRSGRRKGCQDILKKRKSKDAKRQAAGIRTWSIGKHLTSGDAGPRRRCLVGGANARGDLTFLDRRDSSFGCCTRFVFIFSSKYLSHSLTDGTGSGRRQSGRRRRRRSAPLRGLLLSFPPTQLFHHICLRL